MCIRDRSRRELVTSNASIILISGSLGLALLVVFGIFSSDVELEYSEPAEVEPPAEMEPAAEVEPVDFEPGENMELNCNPEIDKDGNNVPDNLDVEGRGGRGRGEGPPQGTGIHLTKEEVAGP